MAENLSVQVFGPAKIIVAAPGAAAAAFMTFGYTQDGAKINIEGHAINVPGDETGGNENIPVEVQLIGETARVRLEMTKWDKAVGNLLAARFPSRLAGGVITPGRLAFANDDYWRLMIKGTLVNGIYNAWNFPCATLVRTPMEINSGTKYSRLMMEFDCHRNQKPVSGSGTWNGAALGVLYNDVLT